MYARGCSPRARTILAAVLSVATIGIFGRVLANGFIAYDDPMYLTWNSMVREGVGLRGLAWAFSTFHAGNWHPLTWVSHMADVSLFGMKPWGHHLTSVLLHAVNAALLLLALERLTGQLWRSAIAAALFALHPLRVESVAWAAERKDVLAAFFAIVLLVRYASYARHPSRRSMGILTVVYVLGLMAKPMLVSLPLLLLLLDYWPLARLRGTAFRIRPIGWHSAIPLVREKLPLFVAAAVFSAIAFLAQRAAGALAMHEMTPAVLRLSNAVLSLVRYLGKAAWPQDLIVFYSFPTDGVAAERVLAAALLLAGATGLVLRLRSRPALAVGWFWYLIAITPVLGIVQIGRQAMADRYTYLPLLGIGVALVWGPRWEIFLLPARRAIAIGAITVLGILSWLTWTQIGYWRDTTALFRRVVSVEPANGMALNMIGVGLLESGDARGAEDYFRAALKAEPSNPRQFYNLGLALERLGESREAKAHFEEAARRDPKNLESHLKLGQLLLIEGDFRAAADHLQEAARLSPLDAQIRFASGNALDLSGNPAGAIEQFQEAIRLQPGFVEAYNNLGAVLAALGRKQEAVSNFREALRLRPGSREARANLERLIGQ